MKRVTLAASFFAVLAIAACSDSDKASEAAPEAPPVVAAPDSAALKAAADSAAAPAAAKKP